MSKGIAWIGLLLSVVMLFVGFTSGGKPYVLLFWGVIAFASFYKLFLKKS